MTRARKLTRGARPLALAFTIALALAALASPSQHCTRCVVPTGFVAVLMGAQLLVLRVDPDRRRPRRQHPHELE
jgi:hypothetical protein